MPRAAEADYGRHHEQCLQIQIDAVLGEYAFQPQQAEHQRDNNENGDVGREKKKNSNHGQPSGVKQGINPFSTAPVRNRYACR
jgi:hypothetical protein